MDSLISDKIYILTMNLKHKFRMVTDYDYEKIATEFVTKNGWKENMDVDDAINDCIPFMAVKLAYKRV